MVYSLTYEVMKRWYGGRAAAASLYPGVQGENSYKLVISVLCSEQLQDSALCLSFKPFQVVNAQKVWADPFFRSQAAHE